MRYGGEYQASRVDANQEEIVNAFRKLGYSVHCLHAAGGGVTDLLVGKHHINLLVEVKDGSRVPSERYFTKPQRKFHFSWQGQKCVVKCLEDVMHLDAQFRALTTSLKASGVCMDIKGCQDSIYRLSLY